MRNMHTTTAAAVAVLLGLAMVFGAADAQTPPRQIILETEEESKFGNEAWRSNHCRVQWRYTFRAGKIFEEMPYRLCPWGQDGQEGVGLVFEPDGSTTSVVRCVQERDSKTLRCSDGSTRSPPTGVWQESDLITTTSSSITRNRIEVEHVSIARGSYETKDGELKRLNARRTTRKIILEFSRSGCRLVEWDFGHTRYRARVKSSTCRIVW